MYKKNFLNQKLEENPYLIRVIGSNISLDRFYENTDTEKQKAKSKKQKAKKQKSKKQKSKKAKVKKEKDKR